MSTAAFVGIQIVSLCIVQGLQADSIAFQVMHIPQDKRDAVCRAICVRDKFGDFIELARHLIGL